MGPRQTQFAFVLLLYVTVMVSGVRAQSGGSKDSEGFSLPNNRRIHVRVEFMAAYTHDEAQTELGFADQGRIGYAILTFAGDLTDRISYHIALNPIAETEPSLACGESNFYYPNSVATLGQGPTVPCEEDGNQRVDMYKYIGLDNVIQQGPMREAYGTFRLTDTSRIRFGRFILPMGFYWEDMGSYTSKDSTLIQRIDAEADFGALMSWSRTTGNRTVLSAQGGAVLGDGHRNTDYNYFYFQDASLDSKGRLTGLGTAAYSPVKSVELRGSVKIGVTGSRVERLPNFFASKRNDDAIVASGRYQPIRFASVFGEWARYTWGPTASSASILNIDPSPVLKSGYYIGADVGTTIWHKTKIGTVITREEISRDDSLVKWLALQNLYDVSLGKKDRATILRVHVDLSPGVTIAWFRNFESTPFPWISGISPVSGPGALASHSTDKWGVVMRLKLP
jgi:hypothetical protein